MQGDPVTSCGLLGSCFQFFVGQASCREPFADGIMQPREAAMHDLLELLVLRIDGGRKHQVIEVRVFNRKAHVRAGAGHPVVIMLSAGFAGGRAVVVDDLKALGNDLAVQVLKPIDIGIQRHGTDADGCGDPANGQRIFSVILQHAEGDLDDQAASALAVQFLPLAGEAGVFSFLCACRGHGPV